MTSTDTKHLISAQLLALSVMGCMCGDCSMPQVLRAGNTTERRMKVSPAQAVAAGTRARMMVSDEWRIGLDAPLKLTQATSADEAVVTASYDGATLILDGHKPGDVLVTLVASVDGSSATDSLRVQVVEPRALELSPCVFEDAPPVYIAGQLAVIPFSFKATTDNLGNWAWGAGRYPVTIDPPAAASVDMKASDADTLVLRIAPDAPPRIKLTSTLPDDPLSFELEIAPMSVVHTLDVRYPRGSGVTRGERTKVFVIYKTAEGRSICSRLPYKAKQSESSKLCKFEPGVALSQSGDIYGAAAGIVVEGVVTGTCQLVLEAAIKGVVTAAAISVIVTAPSGGGGWD